MRMNNLIRMISWNQSQENGNERLDHLFRVKYRRFVNCSLVLLVGHQIPLSRIGLINFWIKALP